MESFDQPDSGYPEEGPPGTAPDDTGDGEKSSARESARPREEAERAPDGDEGRTATGNPGAAGADG